MTVMDSVPLGTLKVSPHTHRCHHPSGFASPRRNYNDFYVQDRSLQRTELLVGRAVSSAGADATARGVHPRMSGMMQLVAAAAAPLGAHVFKAEKGRLITCRGREWTSRMHLVLMNE